MNECPECGRNDLRVAETEDGKLFIVSDCGLAVPITREALEAAALDDRHAAR